MFACSDRSKDSVVGRAGPAWGWGETGEEGEGTRRGRGEACGGRRGWGGGIRRRQGEGWDG